MEQSLSINMQANQAPTYGAKFGLRAGAQVIDLIIHNIVALIVGFGLGILVGLFALFTGTPVASLTVKLQGSTFWDYILALLGFAIYHTICEGFHGATLGKLIFKIHVVDESGNPCSPAAAFTRSAAFYIDALFFGIVAATSMRTSELHQRYGDKWAKTVVIERSQVNQIRWPSTWRFIAVFLIAISADGLLYGLSLILKMLI
jgi:uncharacterized RDD family membrane protein YckC